MLKFSSKDYNTVLLSLGMFLMNPHAKAATTIEFGEDQSVSIGFAGITSYITENSGDSNDKTRTHEFKLNSARLLLSGSLNKNIKGMLKTERLSSNESIEIIDANIQYEIAPDFTIWAGRMLSPSDRAHMAGPYYSMGGGYWAGVASRYGFNGGIFGRDDGAAAVGKAFDRRLTYAVGAFDGDNIFRFSGVGKQPDNNGSLMYSGRLQYNFWDIEPGYYGTANYFGRKDTLSIAIAGRFKKDAVTNEAGNSGNYQAYSADFLLEKRDGGPGTASIEAAMYRYDTGGVLLGEQGKAWLIGSAYLFNKSIGIGQFMPFIRYQKFAADGSTNSQSANSPQDVDTKKFEAGVNYVITPYDSVISLIYGGTKITNKDSVNVITLTVQFQF
jgi:hypothetical protein